MRAKMTIRRVEGAWRLTIPGFGFSSDAVKEFPRWPDVITYLDSLPGGTYGSCERASAISDGIAVRPTWSQWW